MCAFTRLVFEIFTNHKKSQFCCRRNCIWGFIVALNSNSKGLFVALSTISMGKFVAFSMTSWIYVCWLKHTQKFMILYLKQKSFSMLLVLRATKKPMLLVFKGTRKPNSAVSPAIKYNFCNFFKFHRPNFEHHVAYMHTCIHTRCELIVKKKYIYIYNSYHTFKPP